MCFLVITLMTGFVLVLGGSLMPAVEPQTFANFHEAVWWTLITISTVGYGDMVPQTKLVRQVAMGLISVGVVWMSLIVQRLQHFWWGCVWSFPARPSNAPSMKLLSGLNE